VSGLSSTIFYFIDLHPAFSADAVFYVCARAKAAEHSLEPQDPGRAGHGRALLLPGSSEPSKGNEGFPRVRKLSKGAAGV
jgi:hypothetical protein